MENTQDEIAANRSMHEVVLRLAKNWERKIEAAWHDYDISEGAEAHRAKGYARGLEAARRDILAEIGESQNARVSDSPGQD